MVFDRTKIRMAVPTYEIDKIIGVVSGTFNIAAPTLVDQVKSSTSSHVTGFGATCYFQGIFSVDGGTTWNDFGAMIPDLSTPGFPVQETVDCNCSMIGGTLTVTGTSWWDNVHGTGTARTVQYKIALIAKNSQTSITPIPTEEILYYSSAYNYQKIFMKGQVAFNLAGTGVGSSSSVTHGLGYVPKVRAFYQETNGTLRMLPIGNYKIEPRVTTTNVTFYQDAYWDLTAINGNVEYRIYLDD